MCLVGVVVRMYIDFLILLIPIYILFCMLFFAAASLLFNKKKMLFFLYCIKSNHPDTHHFTCNQIIFDYLR